MTQTPSSTDPSLSSSRRVSRLDVLAFLLVPIVAVVFTMASTYLFDERIPSVLPILLASTIITSIGLLLRTRDAAVTTGLTIIVVVSDKDVSERQCDTLGPDCGENN